MLSMSSSLRACQHCSVPGRAGDDCRGTLSDVYNIIYTWSAFKHTYSHTDPRHSHEATPAHAIARKTEAVCHAVAAALPAGVGVGEAGGGAGAGRSPHWLMKALVWDVEHAGRGAVYSTDTGHRPSALRARVRARMSLLAVQPLME